MNLKPIFECLEDRLEEKSQHYGRFSLGPINRGQGITIGNSLRRTLLSDLSGLAITSAKFSNIRLKIGENSSEIIQSFHEFSSIPGIRESIFEILLNLKDVVITQKLGTDNFEIQSCFLNIAGSGILTANSIEVSSNLTIINPDQYIATVVENELFLEIEITVEEGQGARLSKLNGKPNIHSLNTSLPVEANFMPIKKVNYIVEEYKLPSTEGIEDLRKERILLEVWTNGSLHPREAVNKAAQICINLFNPLLEMEKNNEIVIVNSQEQLPTKDTLIEELDLSVRSYNCLKRAQIHTIADLLDYSEEHLLEIKNFGSKSAEEVIEALQNRFDLRLPKTLED